MSAHKLLIENFYTLFLLLLERYLRLRNFKINFELNKI